MESALGGFFSFPEIPLDVMSYETASLLTLTSIAHHGEYIGKGSIICVLHSVTLIQGHNHRKIITCLSGHLQQTVPRFLYAKSTDAIVNLDTFWICPLKLQSK